MFIYKHIKSYAIFLFLGILLFSSNLYAEVTASVNTISVREGNSVTLTIKSTDSSNSNNPDLRVLDKDFIISGTQKGVRNTFVNGKFNSVTEWNILLTPKRIGNIIIPAIKLGKEETRPISIQVNAAGSQVNLNSSSESVEEGETGDVFLKVSVDNFDPYVQSQVLYIVRLYSSEPISQGVILPPQISDAIIEKIGDDIRFESNISGRFYNVLERRFAIFPQKSGKLEIPPIVFEGEIVDSKISNPVEMLFKQSGFIGTSNFTTPFSAVKRVFVRSDSISINVQGKPGVATGKWWLPAYKLSISQEWQPSIKDIKVNEAITRNIKITADGLTGAQLPEISVLEGKDIKVYPGKRQSSNLSGDNGILGVSETSIVLIPTNSGEIVLPEIRIPWWNIKTKRMEEAILPSEKFLVQGSSEQASDTVSQVPSYSVNLAPEEGLEVGGIVKGGEEALNKEGFFIIRIVILIVFFCLFIFLLFYIRHRFLVNKALKKKEDIGSFSAIEKALKQEDSKVLRDSILRWSKSYWQEDPPLNIVSIGKRLKNKELEKELEELERSIYANSKYRYYGDELVKVLKKALSSDKAEKKQVKPVPDLYPQNK